MSSKNRKLLPVICLWRRHLRDRWFFTLAFTCLMHTVALGQTQVERFKAPRDIRVSAEFSREKLGQIARTLRVQHQQQFWVDEDAAEAIGDFRVSNASYWEMLKEIYETFDVVPVVNGGRIVLVDESDLSWRERINPFLGSSAKPSCLVQARLIRRPSLGAKLSIAVYPTPYQFGTVPVLVNGVITTGHRSKKIELSNGEFTTDTGANTQAWQFDFSEKMNLPIQDAVVEGELLVLDAVSMYKVNVSSPGVHDIGGLGRVVVDRAVRPNRFTYGEAESVYNSSNDVELIRTVFTPTGASLGGPVLSKLIYSEQFTPDEWRELALTTGERPIVKLVTPLRWTGDPAYEDEVYCDREPGKMRIQLFSAGEIVTREVWIAAYKVERIPFKCPIAETSI